jgi:serine/threonine protein kinase
VIAKEDLDASLRENPPLAAFLTETLGRRILESDALRQVGKYHLLGEVGRGSMAIVFRGYHVAMQRPAAVKMLSHSLVNQPGMRERFRNEARLLAGLRHPHIVQVYDLEEAYGTWFLVMEWLEGMDLDARLARGGALTPSDLRRVLVEIASALAYAHRAGVVHRDVKPSNIFRLPDGSCRLVDFGIASAPVASEEQEPELMCSPAYVAPEVIEGRSVDGRADVYSLGITAYCLLTGAVPFRDRDTAGIFRAHVSEPMPDPTAQVPDTPADIAAFIERATRKCPRDRFQDPQEIVDLLAPGEATGAPPARGGEIRIRYPGEEAERIAALVEDFRARVAETTRVDISIHSP